jgi:electron transfer flavoprotein alpha/beta subunit
VKRPCDGGNDVLDCTLPILLTVAGEANRPRMPSVLKMLKVKSTPIRRVNVDLTTAPALPGPQQPQLKSRTTPTVSRQCRFLEGATPAEQAAALVAALRHERAIA